METSQEKGPDISASQKGVTLVRTSPALDEWSLYMQNGGKKPDVIAKGSREELIKALQQWYEDRKRDPSS